MDMEHEVIDNSAARRFEVTVDGKTAFSTYRLADGRLTVLHTDVPKELEGKGIGSALARRMLEHARALGLQVIPICPFTKGYIDKHPEYQDLLAGR
jgi:uncharacterized protein